MGLDEVNLRILALLQRNARMSLTELAAAVGRSETVVRERVTVLELRGVLRGYEARVDWGMAGLPCVAIVRATCDIGRIGDVAARLAAIPNVTRVLMITGAKPIMATVAVRDLPHLQSLLGGPFSEAGMRDVDVEMMLQSLVDQRPAVPDDAPSKAAAITTRPPLMAVPSA